MPVARRFVIAGRVQGVGFRYFAQAAASRERLRGWVRNQPDGTVEVLASGDAGALDRFEQQLRLGPPGARVDRISVADTTADGAERDFRVR